MTNIFSLYLKKRKEQMRMYGILMNASRIPDIVTSLIRRGNREEIRFFIRSCQGNRKALIRDIMNGKLKVSTKVLQELEQLKILELYDCKLYGNFLYRIGKEWKKEKRLKLMYQPVNAGFLPVTSTTFGELLIGSLLLYFVVFIMLF